MKLLTITLSSRIVNSILAIALELFIVLLGQDVYQSLVSAYCSRQLHRGKRVRVYRRSRTIFSILTYLLFVMLCVGIELGIDGQVNSKTDYEELELFPSVELSKKEDWVVHGMEPLQPLKNNIDKSLAPQKRKECVSRESDGYIRYHLYSGNQCYNELSSYTSLDFVRISERTRFMDIEFREALGKVFSNAFGSWNISDGVISTFEQLSASYNVSAEYELLEGSEQVLNCSGLATFSVLNEFKYSESRGDDLLNSQVVILQMSGSVFFQIIRFTDIFQPIEAEGPTSLRPRLKKTRLPFFEAVTYSVRKEESSGEERWKLVLDDAEVTAHKIYFALSKIHFDISPDNRRSSEIGPKLVEQLDKRSSEKTVPYRVRLEVPDKNFTVIQPFAPICFGVAILILLTARLVLYFHNRNANVNLRMFDPRFIATLRFDEQRSTDEDTVDQRQIFLGYDGERGLVLRKEREEDPCIPNLVHLRKNESWKRPEEENIETEAEGTPSKKNQRFGVAAAN